MSRTLYRFVAVAFGLSFLPGCGDDDPAGGCRVSGYPAAPAGATGVVHVAAGCSAEGADGSPEHPFPTLQQGIDRASTGGAVLVAGGTYTENVVVAKAVSVIGPPDASDPKKGGIIVQAPAPYAVTVDGATGVLLRGFSVRGPAAVGIWVQKGSAVVEGSNVDGATTDAAGDFGFGVLASDGASLELSGSTVTGSQGIGVFLSGAKGIIVQNVLRANAAGGVRVEGAPDESTIEGNEIDASGVYGIGVFASKAIIVQNSVSGTTAGKDGIADGIVAIEAGTGPTDVHIEGNTLTGNGRTGVLLSAVSKGIIVQNEVSSNALEAVFGAGIWVQSGAGGTAGVEISKNEVTGNRFVGIGVTAATRAIIVQNTAISGTVAGSVFVGAAQAMIGDGVAVLDGSSADVRENTIGDSARFGLIADSALGVSTVIEGNTFTKSGQYGIIVQNTTMPPDVADNTFTDNQNDAWVLTASDEPYLVQTDALALTK